MWIGRSALLFPLEAHTNALPLNQSLPPPSSLTPLSPDVEPHSPVCILPHAVNWLTLTNSAPIKEKNERGNKGVVPQKLLKRYKKGRWNKFTSINSPCTSSSGQAGKPTTCTQLHRVSMSLSSLVCNLGASSSAESSDRREKSGNGKDRLEKSKSFK